MTPDQLAAIRTMADRMPDRAPVAGALHDLIGEVERCWKELHRPDVTVTRAQLPILLGLANGESTEETAARLCLSPQTVKTHRHNLYQRIGARDGAHAVGLGMAAGLIAPGHIDPPGGAR